MKKKKFKKKRARRIAALQMLGGGRLRKAPVPDRTKKLMYAVYRWKRGEIVRIEALPEDPYHIGHSLFKAAEAMAAVYVATGMTFGEAMAEIMNSFVDHAEETLKQIVAELPVEIDPPEQGRTH